MVFLAGQAPSASDLNSAFPGGSVQTVILVGAVVSNLGAWSATLTTVSPCTLAFVAPPSGAIKAWCTASALGSTINTYPCLSMDLSGAAGVANIWDNYQAFGQATVAGKPEQTLYREFLFTGLTPGAAGLITMFYRSFTGGTATYNYRQLGYTPQGV